MVINREILDTFDIERKILKSYNSVYVVKIDDRRLMPAVYGNNVSRDMLGDIDIFCDYSWIFSRFARKFIQADHYNEFIKVTELDYVLSEIENHGYFRYIFRRFNLYDSLETIEMAAEKIDDNHLILTFRLLNENISRYYEKKGIRIGNTLNNEKKTLLIIDKNIGENVFFDELNDEYTVIAAESFDEGINYLSENPDNVKALIIDVTTLKVAGFGCLKFLISDICRKKIPVLIAGENEDDDFASKCVKAGVYDFIPKPYVLSLVRKRLDNSVKFGEATAKLDAVEKDSLTGIYTKEAFYHASEELIRSNANKKFSFFMCDIEHFELLNSKYGKECCDNALKIIAEYFNSIFTHGLVGRFGRDQFVGVSEMDEVFDEKYINKKIEKLVTMVPVPHMVFKISVYLDVPEEMPASNICDRLLMAIMSIKGKYNRNVIFYDSEMRRLLMEEHTISDYMEDSLSKGAFEIYYQAKFDCSNDNISGAEALVRWNHPVLGLLNPEKFIPAFEKSGFITKLDSYVIEKVCADLKNWSEKGIAVPVSVNVSYIDLMEENWIFDRLKQISDAGIENRLLHIELTESVYYGNISYISECVNHIRNAGCLVEMDDFGSGYSTLGMLTELSIDVIKLDASVTSKLEKNEIIADTVIDLAHKMGFKVVAEGVETYAQYVKLKALECDFVQGYYMSEPLSRENFETYLSSEIAKAKANSASDDFRSDNTKEYEIRNALIECISILSGPDDNDMKISKLLSVIVSFYGAERAGIYEFDSKMEILCNTYEWCRPGVASMANTPQEIHSLVSDEWKERFESDISVFIEKVSEEKDLDNNIFMHIKQHNIERVMISKLVLNGGLIGFIEVDNPEKHFDTLVLIESISSYIINDLTRTKNYQMLRDMTYIDAMTGVNNRAAYLEYIKDSEESDDDRSVAVAFIDINNLKQTNDRFGHKAGDNLICSVATVIRSNFSADSIYRYGGDEFVVIIRGIPFDSFKKRVNKLNTFWTEHISASVGCSWSESYENIADLVSKADENMYREKNKYHSGFPIKERRKSVR